MHWVCSNPDCQQVHDNNDYRCDVCGTVRKSRMHLKTEEGKDWYTSGSFDIDRTVYKVLYIRSTGIYQRIFLKIPTLFTRN